RVEIVVLQEVRDAIAHFAGGFIRERDRKNGGGRHMTRSDDVGDTMRDDAGFAATGAGQYQQRAFSLGYGLALLRVQPLKKFHGLRDSIECNTQSIPSRLKFKPDSIRITAEGYESRPCPRRSGGRLRSIARRAARAQILAVRRGTRLRR